MDPRILTDDHVAQVLTMRSAIAAVRRAFLEKSAGTLVAPPRFRLDVPGGGLAFTAGAAIGRDRIMGFRVYDLNGSGHPECTQVVAVYDSDTGALRGLVLGDRIGAIRTGAIGGVALDVLARPSVAQLAVIGTGRHAQTQLEAACAVRRFEDIRVFGRREDVRESFAARTAESFEAPVRAVGTAEEAVREADVVICATNSGSPVFDPAWLADGCHVTTVGPKVEGRHELDVGVAAGAAVIATDSPAQLSAYPRPFFLAGTPHADRIQDLAELVAGLAPGRTDAGQRTLFCSVGLAGTEVVVAQAALDAAEAV